MLQREDVIKQWAVGKEVACHAGLLTWGKATVVEVQNTSQACSMRLLCVGGIWRRKEHQSGYIQWSPTRVGSPELDLNRQDEPARHPDVPRMLWFDSPLVEDSSHTHMFIFESADAVAIAEGMLFPKQKKRGLE